MNIRVESCLGNHMYFRMTDPKGNREFVNGDTWTRAIASDALEIWEKCYHYPRRNIHFIFC